MGLWDKLFGNKKTPEQHSEQKPPQPPQPPKKVAPFTIKADFEAFARVSATGRGFTLQANQLIDALTTLVEQEASKLNKLGLVPPTIETPLELKFNPQTTTKNGTIVEPQIVVVFPRFKLPSYRVFSPFVLAHIQMYHLAPLFMQQVCVFLPPPNYPEPDEVLALYDRDFEHIGVMGLLMRYDGKWFNRDPYAVYRYFNAVKWFAAYNRFDSMTNYHFLEVALMDGNPDLADPYTSAKAICFDHPLERISIDDGQLSKLLYLAQVISGKHTVNPVSLQPSNHQEYRNFPFRLPLSTYTTSFTFPTPNAEYGRDYKALKLIPSPTTKPASFQSFIDGLRQITCPVIFKLAAEKNTIYYELCFDEQDEQIITNQLAAYLPDCVPLEHEETFLATAIEEERFVALRAHPISTTGYFTTPNRDFYLELLSVLDGLNAPEFACVQYVCYPLTTDGFNVLTATYEQYIEVAPEAEQIITNKLRQLEKKMPIWLLAVQLVSDSKTTLERLTDVVLHPLQSHEQEWSITECHPSLFRQGKHITYPVLPSPQFSDSWNLIAEEELITLWHFPAVEIPCERLETVSMKNQLPPEEYTTSSGVLLGTSYARGVTKDVVLPHQVRDRHLYVVGKSGTGKSTLIFNTICQDIKNGCGVAVIDPHGDLAEQILEYIPEERIKDTIYFDASDKKHPIGLSVMNAKNDDEIGLLADDLLVTFKRISESWGERMETILRYTFHTLLRVPGTTFLDIQKILQNQSFREQIVKKANFPPLTEYWEELFSQYPKDASQPILNRMSKFTLNPTLFAVLGQEQSYLNFYDVIQNNKIFLANLSQGKIGGDTSQLLGSLLVSQFQLSIMRRANLPREKRVPFFLYVDEFQNFVSSAFEKILSEARKYQLCLTLAHQYTTQLDDKTRSAILSNVATLIMFQIGIQDANALRAELGKFNPEDLTNLDSRKHEALCKPSTQSKDTFKFTTLPPLKAPQSFAKQIIEYTRDNYSNNATMTPLVEEKESQFKQAVKPEVNKTSCGKKQPTLRASKNIGSPKEQILAYIKQANYLTNPQIVSLCFSHLENPASRAATASRDLKSLIEDKKLKVQPYGKSKIYFLGREPNVTSHNVAVRELFSKIVLSGYEISKVDFYAELPGITPDLLVTFLCEDGSFFDTYFEYDTGSENVSELVSKLDRYKNLRMKLGNVEAMGGQLVFVFSSKERLAQVNSVIKDDVVFAVLNEFSSLNDEAFRLASGDAAGRWSEYL